MSEGSDGGGGVSAEAPAPSAPAEVAPAPAPAPEATTPVEAALAPAPEPEVEIEMPEEKQPAPAVPAPTPAPASAPPPVTDKSSERFSATPPHSPALDPALRQGPTPVSPLPPPPPVIDTSIKGRLGQALEAIRFRKRAKLDKILILAATKKSIKNDDVEKLLRVTDTSATNYLNELVRTGRLKRVGNAHQPTYEPV